MDIKDVLEYIGLQIDCIEDETAIDDYLYGFKTGALAALEDLVYWIETHDKWKERNV